MFVLTNKMHWIDQKVIKLYKENKVEDIQQYFLTQTSSMHDDIGGPTEIAMI